MIFYRQPTSVPSLVKLKTEQTIMSNFIKAKYHNDQKAVEFVTPAGKRLIRSGGSLCWRTNNCGNLSSPTNSQGEPAPKRTKGYIGFAQVSNPDKHFFFIFPDYDTGRGQLKASLQRKYADKSLSETIDAYAPKHENNTANYLAQVMQSTGLAASTVVGSLNAVQLDKLMDAIETAEGYHKDESTRKEVWVETTSITITNGAQPIPDAEVFLETSKGHIPLKANEYGQLKPIPHPTQGHFKLKQKKPDGAWHTLLEIAANTPSKIYNLIVNTISATAPTLSHQAPANGKSKRIPLEYRVKAGDTLAKIASTYKTTAEEIKQINGLKSDMIYPEQRLWLYGKGAISAGHVLPKPVAPYTMQAKPSQGKRPPMQNVPLVRGNGGTSAPTALVPISKTQAPWMSIAVREAMQWAGKKEDVITKTDNYHALAGTAKGSLLNVPWCASFVSYCLKIAGYPGRSASSQLPIGNKDFVKIDKPIYGAIVVLKNYKHGTDKATGSGHITFLYGQDTNGNLLCLGGKQDNYIRISNYKKTGVSSTFPSHPVTEKSQDQKFYGFYVPIAYYEFSKNEKDVPVMNLNKINEEVFNIKMENLRGSTL
jgi:uncharacterized protein (TIGR02594 family)